MGLPEGSEGLPVGPGRLSDGSEGQSKRSGFHRERFVGKFEGFEGQP